MFQFHNKHSRKKTRPRYICIYHISPNLPSTGCACHFPYGNYHRMRSNRIHVPAIVVYIWNADDVQQLTGVCARKIFAYEFRCSEHKRFSWHHISITLFDAVNLRSTVVEQKRNLIAAMITSSTGAVINEEEEEEVEEGKLRRQITIMIRVEKKIS